MKIKVLKRHIEQGKPGRPNSCPIALAIKEATGSKHVQICSGGVGKNHVSGLPIKLSKNATSFIRRFDDGKEVKPFEIDLGFARRAA